MFKNTHIWLTSYIAQCLAKRRALFSGPAHIMFCIADHFEPMWNKPQYETEVERVERWVLGYPKIADRFKDSDGKHPQYTFFYPQEEYRKEHIDKLQQLCRLGFGEIEIHLHHDNDTEKGLEDKLNDFKVKLSRHGLLSRNGNGDIRYGFIHGNWALANSRKDRTRCGVNNELEILKKTGCYADFTLPSAPSDTQTRKINSIYYAKSNAAKPKSHNTGIDVEKGKNPSGDLMIIQGPLGLNWKARKWGILPRIENSEISFTNPPAKGRIDLWIKQHIQVKGRPDWIFVKIYTHGAQEKNAECLLGGKMEDMFSYLEQKYNNKKDYFLHYVTAREMYNIVKAAEAGMDGNPGKFRDYVLKKAQ